MTQEMTQETRAPEESRRASRVRAVLRTALVPVLAIVAALVIGGIVMVFSDPEVLRTWASFARNPGNAVNQSWDLVSEAYTALFRSSLGSDRAISETFVRTTPLVLAGLAVALAFRAGLFNIGAEGQLLAGAMSASFVGFAFDGLPAVIHLPFALLAGFAGGALWGFVPGALKATTGAHEVITTIMLNFIALRLVDYLLKTETFRRPGRSDPISKPVADGAELPTFVEGLRAHAGIFVALLAAYAVWWLLFRSTIGFRFRAVGLNPHAAAYAGMTVAGSYMLALALAGGLAGLAGASELLGLQKSIFPGFSSGYGFDAIALALLGRTHPAGVVAAAFMFGILRAGATGMQAATSVPIDIIVVIQALIIVFVAAPMLVREIFRIKAPGPIEQETLTQGWAS